jgi:hypothetical protein
LTDKKIKEKEMILKTNIELTLLEIVWNNGRVEYVTMNGPQLAGFKRRKGIKKQYLTMKKAATISLQIKTAV